MDRRVDQRVEVRLPCRVEFSGGQSRLFVGVTVNMSRSGILVVWGAGGLNERAPRPGDLLNVDVELPANQVFGQRCIHCQTAVARVYASERGEPMLALQVNQMQFRRYENANHGCAASQDEIRCSII
jgi:hypothetical protein